MNKTVNASQIQIKNFPIDDRIWCITWLGQFVRNANVPSELNVEVTLTPLKEGIDIRSINLNNKAWYDFDNRKPPVSIPVGCGLLPVLRLGSFWQNGYNKVKVGHNKDVKLETERYTKIEANLLINQHTSEITSYASFPSLFDSSYYPLINNNNLSKLLIIDYPQNDPNNKFDKLIIPCTEILRFYYARSTQLARALVNGQLDDKSNKVYNPSINHSYCNNSIGHIHLRQTILDKDAPHVARMAFSPYANKQANSIYTNGIKNTDKFGQFLIEVHPPFEGETSLVCEGKKIKSPGFSNSWSFLVYEIKSCSHPFPFTKLTFSRDNDGRSKGDNEEDKPEAWANTPNTQVKTVKTLIEPKVSNACEPSTNTEITEIEISENNFPDLIDKEISKAEKQENHYKAAETKFVSAQPGEDFSTGAGTYGKTEFKPIAATNKGFKQPQDKEETQKRKEALPANFTNFTNTILELSNFEGISYSYTQLKFDSNIPNDEGCSFFPISINNWAYIDLQDGYRRQFIIVEINYRGHFFYFFEIESDKTKPHDRYSMLAIHNSQFNRIYEDTLKEVIVKCAQNYGRWLNKEDLPYIWRKKFKHTSTSTENCAKKFYNYVKEQVQEIGDIKETPFVTPLEPEAKDDIENYGANTDVGKIA